jgi:predicted nucleic acid-binding protein
MAGNQKKRLALDTNLLLDLAKGLDFAHDFRTVFQQAGYSLLAGPTVFRELGFAVLHGREPEKSQALTAVASAARWGVLAFNLTRLDQTIAERFAQKLLETGLLPEEECNDALILAETAVENIPFLVTSDRHFLDMDADALALAFSDADLPAAHPVHPKALLRAMR